MANSLPTPASTLRAVVREKYGAAARAVRRGAKAACCESSCCGSQDAADPITADHYVDGEASEVPAQALAASLGCGNPTALAELRPGEIVLDLGSGGGIDVLLSARRVGPTGKAYGLDMTDEMLALARENQQRAGLTNVEFLKGEIEHVPLPDASVDVIISNCVINLAADKDAVLREAFRVLKPGGRFAVSDIIVRREVPDAVRRNLELWTGCVAGALEDREYRQKLAAAGFEHIDIEPTRIYTAADAAAFLAASGLGGADLTADIEGAFMSGFVRATKPQRGRG
jgi:ubiquinone/menaquinone biosynthesis C-methylase UbiE